jgi:hypothetical protein
MRFSYARRSSRFSHMVYAVRVDDEWLAHPVQIDRSGNLVAPPVNIGCVTSVPKERILAKAMYVNGAVPGYTGPQPLQWRDACNLRHWKW